MQIFSIIKISFQALGYKYYKAYLCPEFHHMRNERQDNDMLLVAALRLDSHEAFVRIFRQYYPDMVLFASRFILDRETCEDIVQEVFIRIWSNRRILEIRTSLRTYLISLVQHLALNEIRHRKVRTLYQDMNHELILSLSAEEHILYSELNDAVEELLSKLEPEVRETYMLSRVKHLKYSEIASQLNISIRTVEARISKTMKYLQNNLRDYRSVIYLILSFQQFL